MYTRYHKVLFIEVGNRSKNKVFCLTLYKVILAEIEYGTQQKAKRSKKKKMGSNDPHCTFFSDFL